MGLSLLKLMTSPTKYDSKWAFIQEMCFSAHDSSGPAASSVQGQKESIHCLKTEREDYSRMAKANAQWNIIYRCDMWGVSHCYQQ